MHPSPRTRSRATLRTSVATGLLVSLTIAIVSTVGSGAAPAANANTSSAVTITAAATDADIADAPLPGLAVTLSQTANLTSQGLVVSWTGGKQSTQPGTDTGGENFLQVMQCWGDDPSIPAGQPAQPDRTTCQFGGFLTPGAQRDNFVTDEEVAPQDKPYTAPGSTFPSQTYTAITFRPPAGNPVVGVKDNQKVDGATLGTNPYFTGYTSNEVKWAGSGSNGAGSVKFEVQTAQQSSGIDCGAALKAADGTASGKSCWIVVVPRGTADVGETHIIHSGLFWDAWKHRLAFRVGFKPLGVNCPIGAAEKQIAGSELVAGAVASWQPSLCGAEGGSIFTNSTGSESDALVAANDPGTPAALALTSRPLDTSGGLTDSITYAPIAVSGISIAFAIDRQPRVSASTPVSVVANSNQAFTSLKLTPRLIAKLLTNSYLDSLPGDKKDVNYNGPHDPGHNARNLTTDPDFLAINDLEWRYEALTGPSLADLLVPQGRSDVAYQLWRYLLADPDAKAFLAGTPDKWGMIVNPWNSTDAAKNPNHIAAVFPAENFPKSDPMELPATRSVDGSTVTSGPVNLVSWRPYTSNLDTSGYLTLRGDGQILGPWDVTRQPPAYIKALRANPGFQTVLGLTDTASAAKYQIISASLLNEAGYYVSPTTDAMSAAAAAMTPTASQKQVYEFDPAGTSAKAAQTAYPLTMPVYAATNPAQNDAATRASYAAFITFAATTGQTPGAGAGQLPEGYAPLPVGWRTATIDAAAAIAAGVPAASKDGSAVDQPASVDSGFGGSSGLGDTGAGTTPAATTSSPTATGAIAESLMGAKTPKDPDTGGMASIVPLSLLGGLASAGIVPLIARIRRRL